LAINPHIHVNEIELFHLVIYSTNIRRFNMAYTCKNCGAVANAPGHLCNPCGDEKKCSFCGAPSVDQTHICKDKLAAMKFVCGGCGRVAMEENHLCKPSSIG
jgi:hypothetical protein